MYSVFTSAQASLQLRSGDDLVNAGAGGNLELPATGMLTATLKLDQPLLHMTAPAVAVDAAPVIVGMTADRMLKRYVLPKELAGWAAVKGKHLSPQSMAQGPQKVLLCPASTT